MERMKWMGGEEKGERVICCCRWWKTRKQTLNSLAIFAWKKGVAFPTAN